MPHGHASTPAIGYLRPGMAVSMKLPDDKEPPLTLSIGEVLRDELDATAYQIDAFTARGGMGEVYRGRRLSDGALVAVKCVRGEL